MKTGLHTGGGESHPLGGDCADASWAGAHGHGGAGSTVQLVAGARNTSQHGVSRSKTHDGKAIAARRKQVRAIPDPLHRIETTKSTHQQTAATVIWADESSSALWVHTGHMHHSAEGDLLAQRSVTIYDVLAAYVVPLTSRSMARILREIRPSRWQP